MGSYQDGDRPKSNRTSSGRRWQRVTKAVLSQRGTVCALALCGCGGAESLDHIIPVRERPDLEWDLENLQPMHFKPCVRCTERAGSPIRCQYIKGYGSMEAARRILAERIGQVSPETSEDSDWW